jgi:hypothetical protein
LLKGAFLSGTVVVGENGRRGGSCQNHFAVVIGTINFAMSSSNAPASVVISGGQHFGDDPGRRSPVNRRFRTQVVVIVHESDAGQEDVKGDLEAGPGPESSLSAETGGKTFTSGKGNFFANLTRESLLKGKDQYRWLPYTK